MLFKVIMKHHFSAGRLNLNTIVFIGNDICGWCRCYLSVSIIKMIIKHTFLTDNTDLTTDSGGIGIWKNQFRENRFANKKLIQLRAFSLIIINILLALYKQRIWDVFVSTYLRQIIIPKFIYFSQSCLFFLHVQWIS